MAVDVSADLKLSDQLTEWFWNFGVHHQSKYPPFSLPMNLVAADVRRLHLSFPRDNHYKDRSILQSAVHRNELRRVGHWNLKIGAFLGFGVWDLGLGASLDLGAWDLDLSPLGPQPDFDRHLL
jgi:hypothetical protein